MIRANRNLANIAGSSLSIREALLRSSCRKWAGCIIPISEYVLYELGEPATIDWANRIVALTINW